MLVKIWIGYNAIKGKRVDQIAHYCLVIYRLLGLAHLVMYSSTRTTHVWGFILVVYGLGLV